MPRPPKHVMFSKAEAGRRVRAARESRGTTQIELARLLGVPQSNVSDIERGARGLTVHQAVKIARALKLSTDEILLGNSASQATQPKPPTSLKLLRRLQRIEKLPEARQRVVLKFIDALIDQEGQRRD